MRLLPLFFLFLFVSLPLIASSVYADEDDNIDGDVDIQVDESGSASSSSDSTHTTGNTQSTLVSPTIGRGYLIVTKKIDTGAYRLVAKDTNFTVAVQITNIGDSSAYSVSVSDEWPNGLNVIEGEASVHFDEIAAGNTTSYNYTVSPSLEGELSQSRARVEYQPSLDAQVQLALSTATQPITIIGAELFHKLTNTHTLEWGVFVAALVLSILGPFAYWYYIQQNYEQGIPKSKLQ